MSHVLSFDNRQTQAQDGETVLEALLRGGLNPAFSCKSGSCQTCMLQAESGEIPERAQRVLPNHLRRLRYFLPCRCTVQSDMKLRKPDPNDLVHSCQLCEANMLGDGRIALIFETARALKYRTGQRLRLVTGGDDEPTLVFTSDPQRDFLMTATLDASAAQSLAPELQGQCADDAFGFEFEVRGPFDDVPQRELPYPETDAGLWEALGGDATVRRVLEDFYAKVYADAKLSPFFAKVTQTRAIDKQFSFMKQCVTGERIYMGDRPRNAHHWMVITHELFDHRQSLMIDSLKTHGLDDELIARWTAYEEYFRPDIVKSTKLPRHIGSEVVKSSGVTREVIGEATLCDHCQSEVLAGETVLLHHHMGTISCARCTDISTDISIAKD